MNRWLIGGIAGGGALVLAAGATAFALSGQAPAPEPTITPVVQVIETPAPKVTPTPAPAPVPEPIQLVVPAPEPVLEEVPPPEPAGPVLCPAGTSANSSDGYNDTSCMPVICYTIAVPSPEHPECDQAMPPEYYY